MLCKLIVVFKGSVDVDKETIGARLSFFTLLLMLASDLFTAVVIDSLKIFETMVEYIFVLVVVAFDIEVFILSVNVVFTFNAKLESIGNDISKLVILLPDGKICIDLLCTIAKDEGNIFTVLTIEGVAIKLGTKRVLLDALSTNVLLVITGLNNVKTV